MVAEPEKGINKYLTWMALFGRYVALESSMPTGKCTAESERNMFLFWGDFQSHETDEIRRPSIPLCRVNDEALLAGSCSINQS